MAKWERRMLSHSVISAWGGAAIIPPGVWDDTRSTVSAPAEVVPPIAATASAGLPQRARSSPELGHHPDRARKFPTDRREARRHRYRGSGRAARSLLVIAARFYLRAPG